MIKVNELRIGNYFHPSTRLGNGLRVPVELVLHRVTSLNHFGEIEECLPTRVETLVFSSTEVEPVRLTTDLLIKCGFNLNGFKQYEISLNDRDYSTMQKKLFFSCDYLMLEEWPKDVSSHDRDIVTLWNKDLMKVFYLHQLQNLFFALTGQELNITL